MVARAVDAVWMWYVGDAGFKAAFGRFTDDPLDKSWTKDYLQVSGACLELLGKKFPEAHNAGGSVVTYKWPNAAVDGYIKKPNDRFHLGWATSAGAPLPWRLSPNPDVRGPETLPGDPAAVTTAEANRALATYKALGISAHFVAVKLQDEENTLHIRAYIQDPPSGLEFADSKQLPTVLQEVAAKAIPTRACASIDLQSGGTALTPDVAGVIAQLEENPNLLLVGPPGTGKTVLLERLSRYVENPGAGIMFDPDENHNAWAEGSGETLPGKTRTVVFHPSYSYDNLVLGLLPVPTPQGVAIEVATGPLVNLAHYASQGDNRALLVLDEFNRGNAAAILGDTLALLDKGKRGETTIDLAYSQLQIEVPAEFASGGSSVVNSRFSLPPNLWIVAAMNSSDRSVAPLDAALRRRFSIIEVSPDYEALARHLGADEYADLDQPFEDWTQGHVFKLAVETLRGLNDKIDAVMGQDFRLGQSNFWQIDGPSAPEALYSLSVAWDTRIVPTLRLALQDNDEALAAILCAGSSDKATAANVLHVCWWKKPAGQYGSYGQTRLHFNEISALDQPDALRELRRLASN